MRVSCFTTCRGCENGCVQDLPAAAGAVAKLAIISDQGEAGRLSGPSAEGDTIKGVQLDATVERLPVPLTDDPAFLAIFLELSTAKILGLKLRWWMKRMGIVIRRLVG